MLSPLRGCIRRPLAAERLHMRLRRLPLVLSLLAVTLTAACAVRSPSRNPVGEVFPSVEARRLDDRVLSLPVDLAGRPAVLLVGYDQGAQFDADRWLLGLLQLDLDVSIYEVPTIPGALVGLFSERIDSGMRSGIPSEDWGVVATAYGDAGEAIESFTGSEGPRNMRVLLLDSTGVVRWFHDRGYSAGTLLRLKVAVEECRR